MSAGTGLKWATSGAPPHGCLALMPTSTHPCEDPSERRCCERSSMCLLREISSYLTRDEMRYLLEPSDVLGPDCGFETFGALRREEARTSGGVFRDTRSNPHNVG